MALGGHLARCLALAFVLVVWSGAALASSVVVFPLDGRGVARETADLATERMKSTLAALGSIAVIETGAVEKRLGVHLTEQARACEYDVFCLVEVGEILQAERMIIGHVRRAPQAPLQEELELKLFVLDVAKATVVDVLLWRVPGRDQALEEAVQAATRRLFSSPDAELVFDLRPPGADVTFYGDPVPKTTKGAIKYWSGAYAARVRADGFQELELRIVIAPGVKTGVPIELQPDLLFVPKSKSKPTGPFAQPSRREGSGVSAQEAGAAGPGEPSEGSAFRNPFAWGLSGAGVAAMVAGVVIASGAQSDYNTLSMQKRYLAGVTLSASQAIENRDDERSRYQTGAILGWAGAGVAAGGLLWMVIDAAISGEDRPRSVGVSAGPGSASVEVRF